MDFHAHVVPPEMTDRHGDESWRASLIDSPEGRLVAVGGQRVGPIGRECSDWTGILEEMDARRIDVLVASPHTLLLHYDRPLQEALQAARVHNDAFARAQSEQPDRLRPLGTLPMQDPDLALGELERLDDDLGLAGVELGTNVGGTYLGDRRFWPVYAELERRGLCVFVHPVSPVGHERMADFELVTAVGFPLETTLAASHMILSGVLERFPGLKIVLPHGGGALPYLRGRLVHTHAVKAGARSATTASPSDALRALYFDSLLHSRQALRALVDWMGADRVVLGSDYPFEMGYQDPIRVIEDLSLSALETDRILGGNALELLGW